MPTPSGIDRFDAQYQSIFKDNFGNVSRRVSIGDVDKSQFNELLTVQRQTFLNVQATWGISDLREIYKKNDTVYRRADIPAGEVGLVGGETTLNTGTVLGETREIQTIESGQYLAGTKLEAGFGLRLEGVSNDGSELSDGQRISWGYFDGSSGCGYAVDNTNGLHIFIERDTKFIRRPQSEWNIDKLNGKGPSGIDLKLTDGAVYKARFTHYGYGSFRFYVLAPATEEKVYVPVHEENIIGGMNLPDPNQPITIRSKSGDTTTADKTIYLGSRQVTIWGNLLSPRFRSYAQSFKGVTVTSTTSWTPVLAIRKKNTVAGVNNSVGTFLTELGYYTDNPVEIVITTREDDAGFTFRPPERVLDDETSVEVQVANDGSADPLTSTVTGALDGIQVLYDISQDKKNTSVQSNVKDDVPLSQRYAVILWARKTGTSDATIYGFLKWSEQR